MAEKITLNTGEWQELALKWPDGRNLSNEYGESVMFSTIDGRVLFTPVLAAEKVRALKLNPGERFAIRKAEVRNGGPRPHIEWQVLRIDPMPANEQQDGTLVIQRERAAASIEQNHPEAAARIRAQLQREQETAAASPEVMPAAPLSNRVQTAPAPEPPAIVTAPNKSTSSNGHHIASPFEHSGHAALLRDTCNMLVDVLASCKNYASRYNGVVSAEDIRSCMLSAYINISKAGKQ